MDEEDAIPDCGIYGSFFAGFLLAAGAANSGAAHTHELLRHQRPIGDGGNLGGLAGADAHCQELAAAVGAGNKTWHAYLSTQARPGQPAVNARDRIGTGPWYNVKGEMIARDLAHLHGDTIELARLGNNLTKLTGLTEKGEIVPGLYDYADARDNDWDYMQDDIPYSNRHEMLTGSQPDGRAFTDDSTTPATTGRATKIRAGHGAWKPQRRERQAQRAGRHFRSQRRRQRLLEFVAWHPRLQPGILAATHGVGMFYCFAIN